NQSRNRRTPALRQASRSTGLNQERARQRLRERQSRKATKISSDQSSPPPVDWSDLSCFRRDRGAFRCGRGRLRGPVGRAKTRQHSARRIGVARGEEQHRNPKSNIEIAQAAAMRPIDEIAADKLGIPDEAVSPYGKYKAKIALDYVRSLPDRRDTKLILVTAITPTPAGE